MQKLITVILGIALLAAGCDFVKKVNPFASKVDTMEIYMQQQDSIRRAELLRMQQEEARRAQAEAEAAQLEEEKAKEEAAKPSGRYHLIVGAFKTPLYAKEFHAKMKAEGHDSQIIEGYYDFHLVTIKTHDEYRPAVNDWIKIRNQGEHLVWLYIDEE